MKVASIGETDRGGAGLSALKLHHEFLAQGLDSTFYVNRKTRDESRIVSIPNRVGSPENSFRVGQYTPDGYHVPFTTGLSNKDEQFLERVWHDSDVILLRWSSVSVSDVLVSRWSNRHKPLIWCLSDMAPLTGGCHYSMGCDRYQHSCASCPRLPNGHLQIPNLVLRRRKRLWKDIVFVSPSRWLADVARSSAIARDKDIRIIQTGVELSLFKPYDQAVQRASLGLKHGVRTLLFGANSIKDPRKGFQYLPRLVDILNDHLGFKERYHVIVVGAGTADVRQLHCDVTVTGHIPSREELARLYSAADVVVLPYVEDNLPNVCLEAIACGTPVIAFDIGGLRDVIRPGINGQLARPFDVWDLANKLAALMRNPLVRGDIRAWAERHLDIRQQARKYIELFQESLERVRLPTQSRSLGGM